MKGWILGTAVAGALLAASGAGAAALIDGGDIRNNSVTGKDIRDKSLTKTRLSRIAVGTTGLSEALRGAEGAPGPQGPKGDPGPAGPKGDPGTPHLVAPEAGAGQLNASTWTFGSNLRAAVGQQATEGPEQNPGAGLFETRSGDGRVSQFTHYEFGTTIRSWGTMSNIMELWLGDVGTGTPNFSVRAFNSALGAIVQARDGGDIDGLQLNFVEQLRPRLTIEDDNDLPNAVLSIDNPKPQGSIALATKQAGQLRDHLTVGPGGAIRFHGTNRSGLAQPDPGPLSTNLTAADVDDPAELAALINEQRAAFNALRLALFEHGLIEP